MLSLSYSSSKLKLEMIAAMEIVWNNNEKGGYEAVWKALPQHVSNGADYSTVSKWCESGTRRKIQKAAAQTHASSMLRIDSTSRKKGLYQPIECELEKRFKARRQRNCRVSPRWLTHMARHIMTEMYPPEVAARFKGSRGWRQRWCVRFHKSVRKKTNCKKATWEETEPVLQRYFRNLRRRMRGERMLGEEGMHRCVQTTERTTERTSSSWMRWTTRTRTRTHRLHHACPLWDSHSHQQRRRRSSLPSRARPPWSLWGSPSCTTGKS